MNTGPQYWCMHCGAMTHHDENGRCEVHTTPPEDNGVSSIKVIIDAQVPPNTVELLGDDGSVTARFVNVGNDTRTENILQRGTNPLTSELAEWWRGLAEKEIEQTIAKAGEYGGDDLAYMGRILRDCFAGERSDDVQDAEVAIAFYLLGKITRIIGAYKDGRCPSNDSWLDVHVYAGMGIRVREKGGWPNG